MSIGTWLNRNLLRQSFAEKSRSDALAEIRFTVIDIDVSGTDPSRDRIRGIAALPVEACRFVISDIKYCGFPDQLSASPGAQDEWRDDYTDIRQVMSGSVIVTHNVAFVRAMIERACITFGLEPVEQEWLELSAILDGRAADDVAVASIDYWQQRMQNGPRRPHDAAYDVYLMAQMLLAVLSYSEESGNDTLETVLRNQNARTWLHG